MYNMGMESNLQQGPAEKKVTHTDENGTEWYFDDGKLTLCVLPDKTTKSFNKNEKLESCTLPDGTFESFDEEEKLKSRRHPNGDTDYFNAEGMLYRKTDRSGNETMKIIPSTKELEPRIIKDTPEAAPVVPPEPSEINPEPNLSPAPENTATPVPPSKKNFWEKRSTQGGLLALGAGAAALLGHQVGKELDWWGNDAQKKAPDIKNVGSVETDKSTDIPFVAPGSIDLTKEAIRLQQKAEAEKRLAKAEEKIKEIQEKFEAAEKAAQEAAAREALLNNRLSEMEKVKSAPVAPPKLEPKTHQEIVDEIIAKIDRGESITADEASIYNREIPRLKAREAARRAAEISLIPKPPTLGGFVISGPVTPYNQPLETLQGNEIPRPPTPRGMVISGPVDGAPNPGIVTPYQPPGIERTPIKVVKEVNPFQLSPKMLADVETAYENSIEKIFPENTLKNWMNIKGKNAYEFMSIKENAVSKNYKLWNYLQKLKTVTGLEPKSGVRGSVESIEKYIGRALQSAASRNFLAELELK